MRFQGKALGVAILLAGICVVPITNEAVGQIQPEKAVIVDIDRDLTGSPAATQPGLSPTVQKVNGRVILLSNVKDIRPELTPARVRHVWVFLPEGYEQGDQKYPVIYLHDGPASATAWVDSKESPENGFFNLVHDNLVRQGLIHPAIIVAVEPSNMGRDYEYRPKWQGPDPKGHKLANSGGIEEYYGFLAHQLKPYIDSHYRTKTDAANTGVAGCSYGGLATAYLGYKHPETFGMAGCFASSLWWDDMRLVKEMEKDQTPKSNTKFWFQVGLQEEDSMWEPSMRAAKSLTKRGYVEGKDVGLYVDYTGDHSQRTWGIDVAHMFRLFLGTKEPELQHIQLKGLNNYRDSLLVMDRMRDLPLVTLELDYDHGYRANAINPELSSSDPKVFTVDNSRYEKLNCTLVNQGFGVATLQGKYGPIMAEQYVVGHTPDLPESKERYECVGLPKALDVNASLGEWPELKYTLDLTNVNPGATTQPAPAKQSCKFGVWHDQDNVYIAVRVNKAPLITDRKGMPWGQDGIEIRIDARPEVVRNHGRGDGELQGILLFALSPNVNNDKASFVYKPDDLPPGTVYSCKVDAEGYSLQLAIKSDYLDNKQQDDWKEFRLNLDVNTKADGTAPVYKHWWQPDWRTQESVPASGTFVRGELKNAGK